MSTESINTAKSMTEHLNRADIASSRLFYHVDFKNQINVMPIIIILRIYVSIGRQNLWLWIGWIGSVVEDYFVGLTANWITFYSMKLQLRNADSLIWFVFLCLLQLAINRSMKLTMLHENAIVSHLGFNPQKLATC